MMYDTLAIMYMKVSTCAGRCRRSQRLDCKELAILSDKAVRIHDTPFLLLSSLSCPIKTSQLFTAILVKKRKLRRRCALNVDSDLGTFDDCPDQTKMPLKQTGCLLFFHGLCPGLSLASAVFLQLP
jgi:hypothetical protein